MASKIKTVNQKINLDGQEINCVIKSNRRYKNLRFRVDIDGTLIISRPSFLADIHLKKYLLQKSDWIFEKINHFKSLSFPTVAKNKKNYLSSKDQAFDFVLKKLKNFNSFYNLSYNQVRIKNQKNCWGSCSGKKNLNFNYKIIYLPEPLADLIIVHELCHLAEMNHSKNFWQLVSKTIPDYNLRRKELKKLNYLALINK